MELASAREAVFRDAVPDDEDALRDLLESAYFGYRYVDWHEPGDLLKSPNFAVGELQGRKKGQFVSCLKVEREVPPAAWVRLAAVRERSYAADQLDGLLAKLIPGLLAAEIQLIGWLSATGWPEEMLNSVGFAVSNWITSYQGKIARVPESKTDGLTLRPAGVGDLPELAEIERRAFQPIWRLSKRSLTRAFSQAISYDVAAVNGNVVGFQFSVRGYGHRTAHLVRITVHPNYQGMGVGSALLAHAMAGYKDMGLDSISLNTQIDNKVSHKLYKRFGLEMVGDQIPLYVNRIAEKKGE